MLKKLNYTRIEIGDFEGRVDSEFTGLHDLNLIGALEGFLKEPDIEVLAEGRHRVVVAPFKKGGDSVPLAVKCFGTQPRWKDRYDKKRGSKASRSFDAARRLYECGVGTPKPIGYLDRWDGKQLVESYYFSIYAGELSCFRDELNRLYEIDPDCHRAVKLLSEVGLFIRKMHDAGFYHKDLGSQNIMMRRVGADEWCDIQVIDLNRGRVRAELTMDERARDFDRLRVPGVLLSIIVTEYWEIEPPANFWKKVLKFRKNYERHAQSRKWRHISRWGQKSAAHGLYKNIWLWDTRSAQSTAVMSRKERKSYRQSSHYLEGFWSSLKAAPKVRKLYKKQLNETYQKPIKMSQRIGMSLEAADLDWEKQIKLLTCLEGEQRLPVLVRFGHHESPAQWAKTAEYVKGLAESGHKVMVAILQDRKAVLDIESWSSFLRAVIGMTQEFIQEVEVCHAVNRTKWGVWSVHEQILLMEPILELQAKFTHLSFTGPACIDFEYHYVVSALDNMPEDLTLGALSHHLYVDRRGAPENFQGKFSLVEKCALLKAIAENSSRCENRVIVSEVNWPIKGSGVWSPVNSTYLADWRAESSLTVSDDLYGAYMLRYYVIAICSGMVERVYWWRLVAHGFGLVDECPDEPSVWKKRSGYKMLQVFLETLGCATFTKKISDDEGAYFFQFERDSGICIMAWVNGQEKGGQVPFTYREAKNALGVLIEGEVTLSDLPVYFMGVRN